MGKTAGASQTKSTKNAVVDEVKTEPVPQSNEQVNVKLEGKKAVSNGELKQIDLELYAVLTSNHTPIITTGQKITIEKYVVVDYIKENNEIVGTKVRLFLLS
jgi:hypothetical protein